MPISARKKDPLTGFRFRVLIEGYKPIGFSSVAGLRGETTSINYREGDDEPVFRKIPGLTTYDDLVFKRGLDVDGTLQQIRNAVVLPGASKAGEGTPDPGYRFNGFIYLMEKDRRIVKKWQFVNAWARVYGVDELDAAAENIAMETLELVHEGVTLVGSTAREATV